MLGDNIKRFMKENGYTQKELAIRSQCTESAISKYVNNERDPSIKILKNLAIALGVTVDELISERCCKSTADVAQRAEVERLQHILDSYALQYGTVKDQREVMDRIKQETARKIFEEIENIVAADDIHEDLEYEELHGAYAAINQIKRKVLEYKKKYTEEDG